ncbi:MAG: metal-dependent hydrolase [Candidatus Marithrix sp.]
MIVGHLPAGYIFSKLIADRLVDRQINLDLFMLFGVVGSIAPDFDMFYFYFIDHKQHLHHTYWSHYPIIWLGLLLICLVWFQFAIKKNPALLGIIFSVNGFIHMLLDSIVGDIWWFAPFIDKPFSLFTVPNIYAPWWLNFILHWSFVLELLLWIILILLIFRLKRNVS